MKYLADAPSPDSTDQAARTPPLRLAYSVAEAAEATGLGRTTLYNLISSGTLPSRKIGKRRVIRRVDLEELISSVGQAA